MASDAASPTYSVKYIGLDGQVTLTGLGTSQAAAEEAAFVEARRRLVCMTLELEAVRADNERLRSEAVTATPTVTSDVPVVSSSSPRQPTFEWIDPPANRFVLIIGDKLSGKMNVAFNMVAAISKVKKVTCFWSLGSGTYDGVRLTCLTKEALERFTAEAESRHFLVNATMAVIVSGITYCGDKRVLGAYERLIHRLVMTGILVVVCTSSPLSLSGWSSYVPDFTVLCPGLTDLEVKYVFDKVKPSPGVTNDNLLGQYALVKERGSFVGITPDGKSERYNRGLCHPHLAPKLERFNTSPSADVTSTALPVAESGADSAVGEKASSSVECDAPPLSWEDVTQFQDIDVRHLRNTVLLARATVPTRQIVRTMTTQTKQFLHDNASYSNAYLADYDGMIQRVRSYATSHPDRDLSVFLHYCLFTSPAGPDAFYRAIFEDPSLGRCHVFRTVADVSVIKGYARETVSCLVLAKGLATYELADVFDAFQLRHLFPSDGAFTTAYHTMTSEKRCLVVLCDKGVAKTMLTVDF